MHYYLQAFSVVFHKAIERADASDNVHVTIYTSFIDNTYVAGRIHTLVRLYRVDTHLRISRR